MGRLEDEVRDLILDNHRNLAEFARTIGIPEHTLYSALRNGLSGATLTTVIPIAQALKLDPAAIAKGQVLPVQTSRKPAVFVPVVGSIAAGTPLEPDEADDVFPIPAELHERYPRAFILRVEGNSMNRILGNGYLALIDPRTDIDVSGQLYVVLIGNGRATIKRVRLLDNGLELLPDSDDPTYHPIVFDRGNPDAEPVLIIGKVVWYCPPIIV